MGEPQLGQAPTLLMKAVLQVLHIFCIPSFLSVGGGGVVLCAAGFAEQAMATDGEAPVGGAGGA
jgi:hypothetical protein